MARSGRILWQVLKSTIYAVKGKSTTIGKKELKMTRIMFTFAMALVVAVSTQLVQAAECQHSQAKQQKDIVDTAVAAGNFKTLAAALTAADLIKTLKGKGPFTVFAPTDEAFAKLPKGTVEELLKPENREKLIAVLPTTSFPAASWPPTWSSCRRPRRSRALRPRFASKTAKSTWTRLGHRHRHPGWERSNPRD